MANQKPTHFFDEKTAAGYDEHNQKFAPVMQNLHFLMRLVLRDLPEKAHILCVGVGTGADIFGLASVYPGWRFTGIDPSASMLEVCRRRLSENGLNDRCQLFQGQLADLPGQDAFDAVLCLLVPHFIRDPADRQALFDGMAGRLKPDGYLVSAEISYDLNSPDFPDILEKWKNMHRLSGLTEEKAASMGKMMREVLGVWPPEETERLIRQAGLPQPIEFFQALLVRAWYARK